jgi:twinkle protein
MRHGSRGLVIDPYNEIEHRRPGNMTETEYVSQILGRVRRFGQNHGVHIWFVAHPRIMRREGRGDGPLPLPTLYDIGGSANWVNKADLGVVVHRDPNADPYRTEIHVRKVRFKSVGKIGAVALRWDRGTGRYSEIAADATGYKPRVYRDD